MTHDSADHADLVDPALVRATPPTGWAVLAGLAAALVTLVIVVVLAVRIG